MNEELLKKCESYRNREFTIDTRKFIFLTWIERYFDGTIEVTTNTDALLLDISQIPHVMISMSLEKVFEAIETESNP